MRKRNCRECGIQPEWSSNTDGSREGIDSLVCPKCFKETGLWGGARRPIKQWNLMNKKLTAFESFLGSEPQIFTDGSSVISAEILKEEFQRLWEEMTEDKMDVSKIKEDWVHFHWGLSDDIWEKEAMWWLGSKGMHGAKKVWVYYG